MALTLTANIDSSIRRLHVTGTVEVEPGYSFRIGDEAFQLQGFVQDRYTRAVDRNDWYVRRGQDGSTSASHTAGASLTGVADAFVSGEGVTPPSPFTESGPGGDTPDLDAVLGQSSGQDIADALTGAAAPDSGNVFATMADVGGGRGIVVVRAPITPDTPDILTGAVIYTPSAGDLLLYSAGIFSVTEAWDGTTPFLYVKFQGTATGAALGNVDLTGVNAPESNGHMAFPAGVFGNLDLFTDTTPLVAIVDDGSGGDPGSSDGAAEVILVIARPS